MTVSVFDLFKIGIGPSSSHTVGPMVAGRRFAETLDSSGKLANVARVRAEMYGSLGVTGRGHGSTKAVLLGLEGDTPENVNVESIPDRLAAVRDDKRLMLLGKHRVPYNERDDLIMHKRKSLPFHPNGMIFRAFDESGAEIFAASYYSIGGGFVVDESAAEKDSPLIAVEPRPIPYPFSSGKELLAICAKENKSISEIMLANETALLPEEKVREKLLKIWKTMRECVRRGCRTEGVLPGGLQVKRRAPGLCRRLEKNAKCREDPLAVIDWVNLYAIAVNEENAGGGRVVTAPTNGAAGIRPGGFALLCAPYFRRKRRRNRPLFVGGGGSRFALQRKRIHQRRRSRLSRRSRFRMLNGGGGIGGSFRCNTATSRKRRRNCNGT